MLHALVLSRTWFAPVRELSGNGFRNGLEQALHVLQLWPSFIQPVSSQRRQTGSLRGGGAAVLTATCLLVSSLSRFPIAVVSSMIDPFIVFPSVVLFVKWAAPICLRRGYPTAPDSIARPDRARCRVTGTDQRPTYAVRERRAARRSLPDADVHLTQKAALLMSVEG